MLSTYREKLFPNGRIHSLLVEGHLHLDNPKVVKNKTLVLWNTVELEGRGREVNVSNVQKSFLHEAGLYCQ